MPGCDIRACREKQDTEKQQDRGHYGMIPLPQPAHYVCNNVVMLCDVRGGLSEVLCVTMQLDHTHVPP